MKTILGGVFIAVLVAAGFSQASWAASPQDFRFRSLHADYHLGADQEGRSTLKTVETLVAVFPEFNQNHGIERAIPKSYEGHTTNLTIDSVTDRVGAPLHYTTYSSGDNLVLRIGDADKYVHGENTYVITYTQRDVTLYDEEAGKNEFYWDTNGLLWQQPFGEVSATVHLAPNVAQTYDESIACYAGAEGSTNPCSIKKEGNTVVARAVDLGPGENMTVAIGFTAGTFRGYIPTLWERLLSLWLLSLIITTAIGIAAIVWLVVRYGRLSNRHSELAPVPVEYIPPKHTSIQTSSQIGDHTKATTTAQIIDLAVRHYLTIAQTAEKTWFKRAEYELVIVKPADSLLQEEKDFLNILFGSTAVGTKLRTKKLEKNYTLQGRLQSNTKAVTKRIKTTYGLRHQISHVSKSFYTIGTVLLLLSLATLSPLLLVASIIAYVSGHSIRPLTDKGLELRRYLAGLKSYIELAEKDRLAALQSPEGAEKTGMKVRGEHDKKIVRLYERVLPYAVLFGQEKEWNEQLAIYYENTAQAPDWYVGHGAFNAAVFTSAMNSFTNSMNTYGSSSSSSSGGSSGGGSSGGGGGGGGGGGW